MSLRIVTLRIIALILSLFAANLPIHQFAFGQEYKDGIVAVVNEDVITAYDVATFNNEIEKKIQSKYSQRELANDETRKKMLEEINSIRIEAANELINQKLIYAEFVKKGYQLPTGAVDGRLEAIVASQADGDWAKFEEMLMATGTSLDELKEKVEKNFIVDLLITQTVDKNITISPAQIDEYYQKNLKSYSTPKKVRLQIIALERKESVEKNKEIAHSILSLFNAGEKFSDLVAKYSNHPSKIKGGDLGWISWESMRKEFRDAIHKEVKAGEISNPILIEDIIYLIHVSEVENEQITPLEAVYDKIKSKLFYSEKRNRFENYIDELRSKSYVRVFFKE